MGNVRAYKSGRVTGKDSHAFLLLPPNQRDYRECVKTKPNSWLNCIFSHMLLLKMTREEIVNLSDRQIVSAILNRDTEITIEFLYRKCYPLFKSIFDKYYTDCNNCIEFIHEIYAYILWPHKETHVSKLASFGFRCSLTMWLKIVTENYCHQTFSKKANVITEKLDISDRNGTISDSLDEKMQSLNMQDVRKILVAMPNDRFRRLIEIRYLEEKSNEETAEMLGVTMPNYYNMHKRAKTQFCEELRKEGLL